MDGGRHSATFDVLRNRKKLGKLESVRVYTTSALSNLKALSLQEILAAIKSSMDILTECFGGTVRMPAWLITNTADVATQHLHCDNFPVIDDTFVDYGAWQSTAGISVLHVLGDDRDIEILVKVY